MALEFDAAWPWPRNQCAGIILTMASLVERLALDILKQPDDQRTFADWASLLATIRFKTEPYSYISDGQRKWPSHFLELHRKDGLTQCSHTEAAAKRLEQAVIAGLGEYLGAPAAISSVLRSAPLANDPRFEFLQRAAVVLEGYRREGAFQKLMKDVQPYAFTDSASLINGITRIAFKEIELPPHPKFPSFPLFDPVVLRSEFLALRSEAPDYSLTARLCDNNLGLFAVIREARGWAAEQRSDINMLVRDLVWIRNSYDRIKTYSTQDFTDRQEFIGLYVSAVDQSCFYIDRVDLQGDHIILSARREDEAAPRLQITFATKRMDHKLQLRDGIMSGFAGANNSLASWKCLLIRPDWEIAPQVGTILAQAKPPESHLADFYEACTAVSAVGVCYADDLRTRSTAIQERRDFFRKLVATERSSLAQDPPTGFGKFLTDQLLEDLASRLLAEIEELKKFEDMVDARIVSERMIDELTQFVRRKWELIEPAQIITFKQREETARPEDMKPEIRDQVTQLLDRTSIRSYATAPQSPSASPLHFLRP